MKNGQNNNDNGQRIQDVADADLLPWHGRAILLVDLDAFFASVEQMDHPAWRGKPVIVGGDADKRGVVSTASYEARAYGVHSAMAASTARSLCPNAIWTPGRFDRYRQVSGQVMDILHAESPFVQQVSIDEAFVDVTPILPTHEHPVVIARRIQAAVAEIGVTCSVGVGPSKSTAKVASDFDKPRGMTVVYPGRAEAFLAPLPTKVMSGIGPVAQEALRKFGITTLGQVAHADEGLLGQVFGKNASMMRDRCLGADEDAVARDADPAKSISNEISFAADLVEREDIEAAIATVAAKVARRCRLNGLKGRTLTLKVRYGNRRIRTAQRPMGAPCDDEYTMTPVLCRMLDDVWKPGTPVRLVGCALSHFDDADEPVQTSLFDLLGGETRDGTDEGSTVGRRRVRNDRASNLVHATDTVRDRFGEAAVQFGREVRTKQNLTGSGAKNPTDYKQRPRPDEGAER